MGAIAARWMVAMVLLATFAEPPARAQSSRVTLGYLAVLCSAADASAQTFTGATVGRVVDSQQSAVAGASITLHSSERDFERHTFANTQGEYAFELTVAGNQNCSSGLGPHQGAPLAKARPGGVL